MSDLEFDVPTKKPKIIKVIGVGGGGGNAVNHMFEKGDIHDVSFVLCNTDRQALDESKVPEKIQLGPKLTKGLGAGAHPDIAEQAVEESKEDVTKMLLEDGTQMAFITAGMGGGTGTGAGPKIAQIAKDAGILTVGIVTIPFLFEGEKKILQALKGVEEIAQHVDALLVINNEKLRSVYSDHSWMNAFAKADDTLLVAVKSIADIITMPKKINLDFADVKTTLKNGGVAIMATGEAEGENRITRAIDEALSSPLLNNNNIFESKRVLLCVSFSSQSELIMEEMDEINDFMKRFQNDIEVIWGGGLDENLENKVKMTILATGFGIKDVADKNQILSKDQLEVMQEATEAEKAKAAQLISIYYGPDAANARSIHHRRHIFIFDPKSLDDDEIISKVEYTPTYARDRKTLNQIRETVKSEVADNSEHTPAEEQEGSEGNNAIVF